jgi:hypothetical protein
MDWEVYSRTVGAILLYAYGYALYIRASPEGTGALQGNGAAQLGAGQRVYERIRGFVQNTAVYVTTRRTHPSGDGQARVTEPPPESPLSPCPLSRIGLTSWTAETLAQPYQM